jgi:3'-phosphoadenosine 5'-phosphosulfate sulfotransferase (PAPS reductase)/FAD synthetase
MRFVSKRLDGLKYPANIFPATAFSFRADHVEVKAEFSEVQLCQSLNLNRCDQYIEPEGFLAIHGSRRYEEHRRDTMTFQ